MNTTTQSYSLAPTPGGAFFRCSPDPVSAAAGLVLIEYGPGTSCYIASTDGKVLLTATTLTPVLEWLRAVDRGIATLQRELMGQVARVATAEAASAPIALSLADVCADHTHVLMQELGAVRDFEPAGTSMTDHILSHCDFNVCAALACADTLMQVVSEHGLTHGLSRVAPTFIGCLEPRAG